jgi:phage baseplate assembly protein W
MTDEIGDTIGRGFSWPLAIDHTGSVVLIDGPPAVDQSIRMILGTARGERVMRPEFGCRIWDHLFEPITSNNLGLMEDAVLDALGQWEPRIVVEDVAAVQRGGTGIDVFVTYRIRSTNDRRNLVFPFYIIPGEAGPA